MKNFSACLMNSFIIFFSQVCCFGCCTAGPHAWLILSQALRPVWSWDIWDEVAVHAGASPLIWLVVLDKCNLDQTVPTCQKNRRYWRSRDVFANVKLVMAQIGRGKDKTNWQLVPIMVLLGADGPVITGLETCNCTQLWVQLSKFGEAERLVQTEARTAQTVMFAH